MERPPSLLKQARDKLAEHKRAALLLLIVMFLAFAAGSRYGVYLSVGGNASTAQAAAEAEAGAAEAIAPAAALLAVDIKGAVEQPGLYWFAEGQRVNDALQAAGLLAEADTDLLNLAAPLTDGQQLVVPYLSLGEGERRERYNELASNSNGSSSGLVNLNTASLAELTALPGIGDVKAQAIIDYREQNGSFTSVEQLLEVSGIGAKTMDKLRALTCVE